LSTGDTTYPAAANAWHGGIKFPQLAEKDANFPHHVQWGFGPMKKIQTSTALGFPVRYWIIPVFNGSPPLPANPEVVYYIAYDPDQRTNDYYISPGALDDFIQNAAMLAGFADQWNIFAAGSEYTVESAAALDRIMEGDFWGAVSAAGSSWWKSIRDPSWYAQIVIALGAAAKPSPRPGARPLAAPGVAGRSLTPMEMSTHLTTTWEANPVLEQTAQARQTSKFAPPEVVHQEYARILDQFQKDAGVDVRVVPEGTVQGATKTPGNFASLQVEDGVLQIEEQVFRSTIQLQGEVEHELASYYTGAPPRQNIPRLGESPFFANDLMEMMIQGNGQLPSMLPKPPSGFIARFVAALAAQRLKYPPKNDDEAKKMLSAVPSSNGGGGASSGTGGSDPFGDLLKGLTAPVQGQEPTPPGGGTPNLDAATANARLSPTVNDDAQLVLRVARELQRRSPSNPVFPDEIGTRAGLSWKRLVQALLVLRQSGLVQATFSGQREGLPKPTAVWVN
jgi:hypothetical protein